MLQSLSVNSCAHLVGQVTVSVCGSFILSILTLYFNLIFKLTSLKRIICICLPLVSTKS